MITKATSRHDHVRDIAARLRALLTADVQPDIQELASARWAFASALMQLLATKERYIYAKLEQDARPDVKRYFDKSKIDLQLRFDAYTAHMHKWPTSGTCDDWPAYRKSAIHVVDLFMSRLTMEETDLFIYVQKIGLDISHPAIAISNWTRQAFQINNYIGH